MRFAQLAFLVLISTASILRAEVDWSSLASQGYISDFAQVLNDKERTQLGNLLGEVEGRYHVRLALATVPSLERYDIKEVTKYLYDSWHLGSQTGNQSALMLISPKENAVHLYVGMGLRGVLSNKWLATLDEDVGVKMGRGEFSKAAVNAVAAMVRQVHENVRTLPKRGIATAASKALTDGSLPVAGIVATIFGAFLVISTMARAQSQKSVYETGTDFERGRNGPFGGKKPRML